MNFQKEWDEKYKQNKQMSIWPWSDLVSYVMRYARPHSGDFKVLELGCGAGANIPFFEWLGVKYFAIEGSHTIVSHLSNKFPKLEENIVAGDFTETIPFDGPFDLVVDRSSLTHNKTSAIINALSLVLGRLKPGGKFIGIDWFSTEHAAYFEGENLEDPFTKCNYRTGQFADIGVVHFSSREHLEYLFADFVIETLEHKIIRRDKQLDAECGKVFAAWNFVAIKRISR